MTEPVQIRVGVLSSACLVNKMWEGIHRAGFHVAILGCRDISRGQAFVDAAVEKLGPLSVTPRVGTYEDVINAPDVDVIYIPMPTTTRDRWVRECIKAGKHVVGEKPPAKNAEELQEWLTLMMAKNLLYMDGTMFSHGTRLLKVKETVAGLGNIKHIDARITFLGTEEFMKTNCRVNPDLEPYGALGDLGWYCIRWIMHLMDFQAPDSITSKVVTKSENGAILALEAQLKFTVRGEIVTATLYSSFTDARIQRIRVFADQGVVTLQNGVNLPPDSRPHYFVRKAKWDPSVPISQEINDDGDMVYAADDELDFHYQIDHVWVDVANSLVKSSPSAAPTADPAKAKIYADYAYKTQKIMDEIARDVVTIRNEGSHTRVLCHTRNEERMMEKNSSNSSNFQKNEKKYNHHPQRKKIRQQIKKMETPY
eukprot:gene5305-3808_t